MSNAGLGMAEQNELDRYTIQQDADRADEQEVCRLAKLPEVKYDREREAAAEKLGIRKPVLDKERRKKRRELGLEEDDAGQGHAVELGEVALWYDDVDGEELAKILRAVAKKYAVWSDAAVDVFVLWVLLSWTIDCFRIAPRLAITSPTKGCGKSTVLELLGKLVRRPLPSGSVTSAALFRAIDLLKPTFLLDENEKYLELNSDFHALLNEGHKRGSKVLRVLGDKQELRAFDTFCLVAFARNGKIPDDLEQRSIVLEMKRRLPGEPLEVLPENSEFLENLARMCARWADDHSDDIAEAQPDMGGIINRVADNWRPLFALADTIGFDWPDRVREAYAALMPSADRADSNDTMLLADIKAIFDAERTDKLSSERLCELLAEIEGHPWAEYGKSGKPITKNKLAYRLDRFGVRSNSVRVGDKTPKGYHRQWFEEAWTRYLPQAPIDPRDKTQHRNKADSIDVSGQFQNATPTATRTQQAVTSTTGDVAGNESVASYVASHVAFQKCEKSPNDGPCCDVAFQKPPLGRSSDAPAGEYCPQCGQPGNLLETWCGGDVAVWLHRECQDAYRAAEIPPMLLRNSIPGPSQ